MEKVKTTDLTDFRWNDISSYSSFLDKSKKAVNDDIKQNRGSFRMVIPGHLLEWTSIKAANEENIISEGAIKENSEIITENIKKRQADIKWIIADIWENPGNIKIDDLWSWIAGQFDPKNQWKSIDRDHIISQQSNEVIDTIYHENAHHR